MFVDLSVPLVGAGAAKLMKLKVPSNAATEQRIKAAKMRGLKKADLEKEVFFIDLIFSWVGNDRLDFILRERPNEDGGFRG